MSKSEDQFINSADWEIWYQDNFEIPGHRKMELAGCGLVNGLVELWARHLYETVQRNGAFGFSRFNLWWRQQKTSIVIIGEVAGQVKIRNLVFGQRRLHSSSFLDIADTGLLELISEIHAKLVMRGQTCEEIILIARQINNREDFIEQINKL